MFYIKIFQNISSTVRKILSSRSAFTKFLSDLIPFMEKIRRLKFNFSVNNKLTYLVKSQKRKGFIFFAQQLKSEWNSFRGRHAIVNFCKVSGRPGSCFPGFAEYLEVEFVINTWNVAAFICTNIAGLSLWLLNLLTAIYGKSIAGLVWFFAICLLWMSFKGTRSY